MVSVRTTFVTMVAALGLVVTVGAAQAEVDVDAAQTLFKQNDCNKCHNPERDRKGPSLKRIAGKYKGKAYADAQLVQHMTKGGKVKLDDGSEEDHKILDSNDPKARKNLADWILTH